MTVYQAPATPPARRECRRDPAGAGREKGIAVNLRTVERAVTPPCRELVAQARATVRFETRQGEPMRIDFGALAIRGCRLTSSALDRILWQTLDAYRVPDAVRERVTSFAHPGR